MMKSGVISCALATMLCLGCGLSPEYCSAVDGPIAHTKTGPVQGETVTVALAQGRKVDIYKGIPFAAAPVGEFRFHAAKYPHATWSATRQALIHGPSCIQTMSNQHIPGESSEDCLYINVYAPHPAEPNSALPIMLWIYGGGFRSGSSTLYPGEVLAALGDVVVVTFNYRLGALGFLASEDNGVHGNMGLVDQLIAMQWVQDNIAGFYGDPAQVTIFGESAGSASVMLQLLSPMTKGYFIHAIAESGSVLSPWADRHVNETPAITMALAQELHCLKGQAADIACMRNATSSDILAAQKAIYSEWEANNRNAPFIPVVGTEYLPVDPVTALKSAQFQSNVKLLTGVNHDEWSLFLLHHFPNGTINASTFDTLVEKYTELGFWGVPPANKAFVKTMQYAYTDWTYPESDARRLEQLVKVGTDIAFTCPTLQEVAYWSAVTKDVYLYQYSHVDGTYPSWAGVPHAAEVVYVFGLPLTLETASDEEVAAIAALVPDGLTYTPADKQVSHNIINIWTSFAHTGNPSTGLPPASKVKEWPAYNTTTRQYVDINTELTIGNSLHNDKCQLFAQLAPFLHDNCN